MPNDTLPAGLAAARQGDTLDLAQDTLAQGDVIAGVHSP